jgi:hypothetical protein
MGIRAPRSTREQHETFLARTRQFDEERERNDLARRVSALEESKNRARDRVSVTRTQTVERGDMRASEQYVVEADRSFIDDILTRVFRWRRRRRSERDEGL